MRDFGSVIAFVHTRVLYTDCITAQIVRLYVCLFLFPSLSRLRGRRLMFPRRIKEQHCYCAPDLAKEYSKYDKDPRKFFRMYTGKRVRMCMKYMYSQYLRLHTYHHYAVVVVAVGNIETEQAAVSGTHVCTVVFCTWEGQTHG